jgi:peptide deformylase
MIITDIDELKKPNTDATEEEIQECLMELEKELAASQTAGAGLAAPQIGIHKRVAIVRTEKASLNLVNPKVISKGKMLLSKDERCLSLPGVCENIWRYGEIAVKDDTNPNGIVATGFLAIVIQHEMDHLDGILITDRAVKAKVGRNDPCPCGAEKDGRPVKFKRCHGRR